MGLAGMKAVYEKRDYGFFRKFAKKDHSMVFASFRELDAFFMFGRKGERDRDA